MNKRPVETIMGIVVLLIAGLFLYFAYSVADLQAVKGYNLSARFLKVGGLNIGADVMINGIKIGTVIGQSLDNENYEAKIKLSIAEDVKLPKDSVAMISSNGLMGNKFIKIEPGKSSEILKNNDEITRTKDFKTIEDMVGEVIFMVTGNDEKDS
ncbi:MAG: outer membrane lipid asymmetry maintenance protein MlaD [Alphaproteobacteria bacterium]|nr:outer membrane lipid asymmetry maintenance protein MlaD [Alphaproteobacteria bacterium]